MTIFYDMTDDELLRYIDRSDAVVAELASRLEEALSELDFLKSMMPDEDSEIE